ncbi:hypothetical protein PCH_Pc21g13410 [Penicillium rubens Wisconsin 54-1255]|uniref:Uncharacterized protein n=1 Tax=Penicillium rubens (strain ATCC 28089 / DSM 1075 / NRRL 1951 / Wisconsin 54-1255) TaxID=500485 RepID=B6HMV1_PENRW|nr:hypothetical protein PCH_Pc21g13410 [Penicillium rubens Wisconsin 54-1255]
MIGDPVMPEAQRFIADQIRQDLASAMPWNYGFGSFLVILARVVRRLGCATLPQNGVNLQGWPLSNSTGGFSNGGVLVRQVRWRQALLVYRSPGWILLVQIPIFNSGAVHISVSCCCAPAHGLAGCNFYCLCGSLAVTAQQVLPLLQEENAAIENAAIRAHRIDEDSNFLPDTT